MDDAMSEMHTDLGTLFPALQQGPLEIEVTILL
jgi:hypothetical protein